MKRSSGGSDLLRAAREGRVDRLRDLIVAGADVEDADAEGVTALIAAADSGHAAAIAELLGRGAAPDSPDLAGNTPLLMAARRGCVEAVRELLDFGAALDHANLKGQTALFLAASYPQYRESPAATPWTRHAGHDLVVRELLTRGAETEFYETGGLQPVSAAAMHGNVSAMIDLLAAGARFLSDEVPAIMQWPAPLGLAPAVAELIGHRTGEPDPDGADYHGWTPLPDANPRRRNALLSALLEAGAGFAEAAKDMIEERIAWLEARGEEAYDKMYDSRGGATACYSDSKGYLDDARALAIRIERFDTAARLAARLDHIKAVFRSQFP